MEERDSALDAVKGFAMIVVMLGHCIVKNNMVDPVKDPYIYDLIKTVEMPLFILVSGYLAGLFKKPDSFLTAIKIIQKRAISYLVPFFVWIIISELLSGKWNVPKAVLGVLFHLDWGLWFLMTLFIITTVVTLADCLPKWYQFIGAVFACYILFFIQGRTGNTFLSPHLTVRYMPYYVLGFLVTRYLFQMFKDGNKFAVIIMKNKVMWALWAVSLAGWLYLIITFDMVAVNNTRDMLIQMLASLFGSYVCFFAVYKWYNSREKEINCGHDIWIKRKFSLSLIGKYTLEIYVLHFRFVRMLGFYKLEYPLFSVQGILIVAASFLVMSVFTWLIIVIVKKIPILNFVLFGKLRKKRLV